MRNAMLPWLLVLIPCAATAQLQTPDVAVLLSAQPGAPTPEAVVAFDYTGAGAPPLASTAAPRPLRARFLLPFRAEGKFAALLRAEPQSARAELERFVLIDYAPGDIAAGAAALANDPSVQHVQVLTPAVDWHVSPTGRANGKASATQDWIDAIGLPAAWQRAGGWSLVGVLDMGLQTAHPALSAFDPAGQFSHGNFLTAYSADLGTKTVNGPLPYDTDVDELEPEPRLPGHAAACDPDGDGWLVAKFAGHGTHVAGLIAANASIGNARGACLHCGISMVRQSTLFCSPNGTVVPARMKPASAAGLTLQADLGVQIVNMSFGEVLTDPDDYCLGHVNDPMCKAIAYAAQRDVLMVASSGNARSRINFPAGDPRVVAVGGSGNGERRFEPWDEDTERPDYFNSCPLPGECGTNFSQPNLPERQEAAAPARRVLGLFYAGLTYNTQIACGDGFGAPAIDGVGWCTGTSMSAPIYAGVAGIVRSINPLAPLGDPDVPAKPAGVRNLMARGRLPGPANWDAKLGYGVIQADVAVAAMLGTSQHAPVANRLTPLFGFSSANSGDRAMVATPQSALAFAKFSASNYVPEGQPIRGYPALPGAAADGAPLADIFVLTTQGTRQVGDVPPVPLNWMSRRRDWPAGCLGNGCLPWHRDHLLATAIDDVEALHAQGYDYRGVQGYVHPVCAPHPHCRPPETEALHRQCNEALDDCAVFLEPQRAAMEAKGYVSARPAGAGTLLGYAYPNRHSDGDDLVDGMELWLGTNPHRRDSDRDGRCDHAEYSVAGIPVSDACAGPRCGKDLLISDGFEEDSCQ